MKPKELKTLKNKDFLMRPRLLSVLLTLIAFLLLTSCSTTKTSIATSPSSRTYQGTASVGDFMTITIDSNTQLITYADISNGDKGVVPYVVNSDGTYTLNDPKGNLIAAYEVPNYALLIQATKTGPNMNSPALITAVESGQISLSSFEGKSYNYMQFRTASGGLEVGSVTISSQAIGSNSSYWPYGALNQGNQSGSPFNSGTLDFSQARLDSSGTFLTVSDGGNGSSDYIFGTANGIFAVDTPNGAILGLRKASSKNFDPSFAGTYKTIYYQKVNASSGLGNVETGTPGLGGALLTVNSSGGVTVTDGDGNTMMQATLTPVADASYLYGSSGELQNPCNGIFTFRITTANSQQDVFISFMDRALLFSSFSANLPWTPGVGTYNYMYGVGLK
jgi:hypothetical protein